MSKAKILRDISIQLEALSDQLAALDAGSSDEDISEAIGCITDAIDLLEMAIETEGWD